MIEEILEFNKRFVRDEGYKPYITSKYPDKKLAILSCMDTRLTKLLPAALGLKNGDAKIVKNAGGVISDPFDGAVRSLLVAVYELGVETILVIGHTDCGVCHMDSKALIESMKKRGVSGEIPDMMRYCGIDFEQWLSGFDDVTVSVRRTVELLQNHPLLPEDLRICGFVMDSSTGELLPAE